MAVIYQRPQFQCSKARTNYAFQTSASRIPHILNSHHITRSLAYATASHLKFKKSVEEILVYED